MWDKRVKPHENRGGGGIQKESKRVMHSNICELRGRFYQVLLFGGDQIKNCCRAGFSYLLEKMN